MFSKLKQIKDLRSQAKKLQNTLASETVTEETWGGRISLVMDGNQQVRELKIDPEVLKPANKEKITEELRKAFNSAVKSVQKVMAKKIREQGGLGSLGNISELLK